MKSRYAGSFCPSCKNRINIGDEIEKYPSGKWGHVECPEANLYTSTLDQNKVRAKANNVLLNIDGDALAQVLEESFEDEPKKEFTPSVYQQAIFDFITNGKGHAVVVAVAGSGKTTTIVEALSLTPEDANVAFVAYNKHIATELKKRAPEHVHVSTLHSLGLQVYRNKYPRVKIDDDKVGLLLEDIYPVSKEALDSGKIDKSTRKDNFTKRLSMRKLVSICKSVLADVDDQNEINQVIDRYGIEIDEAFRDELVNTLPDVMERCKKELTIIDFDDMIWLPLVLKMKLDKFDFLFVDEAQDMNKSQIEFILGSVSDTGRIIAVGDPRQSLYGFRGADTEAIQNIIDALKAITLPLSVTYRCPMSHVKLAQSIVPEIEPRENAPDGLIEELRYEKLIEKLQAGDMVICRTNAPLIKPAFACIRAGKKAIIRGRDIGQSLVALIRRFDINNDLAELEKSLFEYFHFEYEKLINKGREMQAILLQDRVDTIHFMMSECSTVKDLEGKILMLFDDNAIGIIFSSVHRAKGLEADNVFILRQDLMPHPKANQPWQRIQEMNALYVAQTRSKENLYFVIGGENV